ncbi:MAG: acetyl-CoA carboxylase biotin carboxyl carrier protein subunit [Caulobacteraceae bacterium]|nr:acetyl-CoA carboxylase biotin carboxyl carrier protein subunit [Caulobacteraceae bacterium]
MSIQVRSEITGNIWKLQTAEGAVVGAGETLLIMESMKMEIVVEAPSGGVCRFKVAEGDSVQEGELLAVIE